MSITDVMFFSKKGQVRYAEILSIYGIIRINLLIFASLLFYNSFVYAQPNYQYDSDGRLITDLSEGIIKIEWNNIGKVTRIIRADTSHMPDVEFAYDADGNRTMKLVKPRNGNNLEPESNWQYTYYVLDENENVISTYSRNYQVETNTRYKEIFKIAEHNLYKSSERFGVRNKASGNAVVRSFIATISDANIFTNVETVNVTITAFSDKFFAIRGSGAFELTNHLGNVLSTVADRKYSPMSGRSYLAEINMSSDYYPGGMPMPNREQFLNRYRYSYNKGSEHDDEIVGLGNHFTTFYREGDTRLLRWWSIDNNQRNQSWLSTYSYMDGNPVAKMDPQGDIAVIDDVLVGAAHAVLNGENVLTSIGKQFENSAKIYGGLFASNPNKGFFGRLWEVTSRLTYQLPQTATGFLYASVGNWVHDVNIEYADGATVIHGGVWGTGSTAGMATGSYISLLPISEDPESNVGIGKGSYTFMHEYGHYIQSQKWGLFYIPVIGIPSTFFQPSFTETGAARNAADYFEAKDPAFKWDVDYGFTNNIPDRGYYIPERDPNYYNKFPTEQMKKEQSERSRRAGQEMMRQYRLSHPNTQDVHGSKPNPKK